MRVYQIVFFLLLLFHGSLSQRGNRRGRRDRRDRRGRRNDRGPRRKWRQTGWSECNDCVQTREVICTNRDNRERNENECDSDTKPGTERSCCDGNADANNALPQDTTNALPQDTNNALPQAAPEENQGQDGCPPRVRRELRSLSDDERSLYLAGVLELMNRDGRQSYGYYARTHANPRNSQTSHGEAAFFWWHRAIVYQFENSLRGLGGRYRCITVPYWDFTLDWGEENSGLTDWLNNGPAGHGTLRDGCVPGNFRNAEGPNGRCIERGDVRTINFYGPWQVQGLITEADFQVFWERYEAEPHARVHNYIGGLMATMNSAYDPIFYVIHGMVDRMLSMWQDCHDYDRILAIDLTAGRLNYPGDIDAELRGLGQSLRDVWSIQDLGYSYDQTIWWRGRGLDRCNFNIFFQQPRDMVGGNESTLPSFSPESIVGSIETLNDIYSDIMERTGNPSIAFAESLKHECKQQQQGTEIPPEWYINNNIDPAAGIGICDKLHQ